jgi:hypothetical protein
VWALGASWRSLETLVLPPSAAGPLARGGIGKSPPHSIPTEAQREPRGLALNDECLRMIGKCWPKMLRRIAVGGASVTFDGVVTLGEP